MFEPQTEPKPANPVLMLIESQMRTTESMLKLGMEGVVVARKIRALEERVETLEAHTPVLRSGSNTDDFTRTLSATQAESIGLNVAEIMADHTEQSRPGVGEKLAGRILGLFIA